MNIRKNIDMIRFLTQVLQGTLIGLGAVLPGISGGVLCVVFGIYKIIMEFLADPIRKMKTHLPMLFPYAIGVVIGFMGVANILSLLLNRYPQQSICVFIGLIIGMLPTLWREAGEQGRNRKSYLSMMIMIALIIILFFNLKKYSVSIVPNFWWYLFSGFCLAISVIAPGMSFSTLLMPLGLYEPFVSGIGHLDFRIILPVIMGALITVILFAKAVNILFTHYYSVSYHAVLGVVIAATAMILPVSTFLNVRNFVINGSCVMAGVLSALALDEWNQNNSYKNG